MVTRYAVNIRKFVLRAARLRDLVELGSLTPHGAAFLEASVRAGPNLLVSGGTQTGNTSCELRQLARLSRITSAS